MYCRVLLEICTTKCEFQTWRGRNRERPRAARDDWESVVHVDEDHDGETPEHHCSTPHGVHAP